MGLIESRSEGDDVGPVVVAEDETARGAEAEEDPEKPV